MYTNYNMWLILASFILLLAMVGSITIVMKTHSSSSNTTNINRGRGGFTQSKPQSNNLPNTSKRFASTLASQESEGKSALDPWFVTGFVDGDGCFTISITEDSKYNTGWRVRALFTLGVKKEDLILLEQVKNYFGVGSIYDQKGEVVRYHVTSEKDLEIIINHFDKYPLISQKLTDFLLFKQCFELKKSGEHLTLDGLTKIVEIKALMNWGLSTKLQEDFNVSLNIERPLVINPQIPNPQWVAGFTSGEGNFAVQIYKAKTILGEAVKLFFVITQHVRDQQLMINLMNYLGCGKVTGRIDKNAVDLKVTKFSDINEKILPFFEEYPILGVKSKDFKDSLKIAELIKNKEHLTAEGLDQIRLIHSNMNSKR